MEEILTYLLVFGLLIGFTILYFYRKDKTNVFRISTRQMARSILALSVEKQAKQIRNVLLEVNEIKTEDTGYWFVELIDENRQRMSLDLDEFLPLITELNGNTKGILFSYNDFKEALNAVTFHFSTFRFGYLTQSGIKIKTHELAISSHWNLYCVDSGKYN